VLYEYNAPKTRAARRSLFGRPPLEVPAAECGETHLVRFEFARTLHKSVYGPFEFTRPSVSARTPLTSGWESRDTTTPRPKPERAEHYGDLIPKGGTKSKVLRSKITAGVPPTRALSTQHESGGVNEPPSELQPHSSVKNSLEGTCLRNGVANSTGKYAVVPFHERSDAKKTLEGTKTLDEQRTSTVVTLEYQYPVRFGLAADLTEFSLSNLPDLRVHPLIRPSPHSVRPGARAPGIRRPHRMGPPATGLPPGPDACTRHTDAERLVQPPVEGIPS
jgi:hypothetical protein